MKREMSGMRTNTYVIPLGHQTFIRILSLSFSSFFPEVLICQHVSLHFSVIICVIYFLPRSSWQTVKSCISLCLSQNSIVSCSYWPCIFLRTISCLEFIHYCTLLSTPPFWPPIKWQFYESSKLNFPATC
jgi:hypothetical protein